MQKGFVTFSFDSTDEAASSKTLVAVVKAVEGAGVKIIEAILASEDQMRVVERMRKLSADLPSPTPR